MPYSVPVVIHRQELLSVITGQPPVGKDEGVGGESAAPVDPGIALERRRLGGPAEMSTATDINLSDLKKRIPSDVFEQLRSGVLESKDSVEILTWSIESFHPRLALSCSFGDPEGMVLLDMMHRIESSSRVYLRS
jgi:hypothetical protein